MNENVKIFITGISGLLGSNLIEDLLAEGYQVKAIIRNKFEGNEHSNLKLIKGDFTEEDLTHELQDIDICIHIAALTSQFFTSYEKYNKVNVEGTKQLYQACKDARVKKFIFISSANTMGHGNIYRPGDESEPMKYPFTESYYALSKNAAEDFLLGQNESLKTIILNPTFMIGGLDSKPSSGRIILMALNKKIIFYPPGGKNFVPVKDVSRAIIRSIKLGRHGHRYLVCSENMSYKIFYQRLNKLVKKKPIMIKLPKELLVFLGYVGELLRFFNFQTSLSTTNMKILCTQNYYSNKKSLELLKMYYSEIDDAIRDAVQYFEKHKTK